MFDKEYRFKGSHAIKVVKLTGAFDSLSKAQLFKRNVDVYTNAPLIGFLYGRLSESDTEKNPETGQVYDAHIMGDRVIGSKEELLFNFRMIMLLDKEYEPNPEKRLNKAFRHVGEDPADEERFDSYVRGGIDVLYSHLIENAESPSDYINNLYEFLEDFYEKFNETLDNEEILKLCSK